MISYTRNLYVYYVLKFKVTDSYLKGIFTVAKCVFQAILSRPTVITKFTFVDFFPSYYSYHYCHYYLMSDNFDIHRFILVQLNSETENRNISKLRKLQFFHFMLEVTFSQKGTKITP